MSLSHVQGAGWDPEDVSAERTFSRCRVWRGAQYSFLHALDLGHVRRTCRTVWCRSFSADAFHLGNHPEVCTVRLRATVEFPHQDRVVGRFFAVKDANHVGESLALDPHADHCAREQLTRYWADASYVRRTYMAVRC